MKRELSSGDDWFGLPARLGTPEGWMFLRRRMAP
jgi:hypothetical protein